MVRRPGLPRAVSHGPPAWARPQLRLWPPRSSRVFGKIFRRNMPYGTVTDYGTMFVGFSADQRPLAAMLGSMVGSAGGPRDALTKYTRPLTGAYYFVPASESLRHVANAEPTDDTR
jgi:deferrochelatase/peroxidase EfeB